MSLGISLDRPGLVLLCWAVQSPSGRIAMLSRFVIVVETLRQRWNRSYGTQSTKPCVASRDEEQEEEQQAARTDECSSTNFRKAIRVDPQEPFQLARILFILFTRLHCSLSPRRETELETRELTSLFLAFDSFDLERARNPIKSNGSERGGPGSLANQKFAFVTRLARCSPR